MNKKQLYESIMTSVAKEVKKTLNEYYKEIHTTEDDIDPDTFTRFRAESKDDLSSVISHVSGYTTYKGADGKLLKSIISPRICVCAIKQLSGSDTNMLHMIYPYNIRKKYVNCGATNCPVQKTIKIRPATQEEIRLWRNAEGNLNSLRKTANTIEKIKKLKNVKLMLDQGGEIITEL